MRLRNKWAAMVLIALLAGTMATGCGSSNLLGRIVGGLGNVLTPNHKNDLAQWKIRTEKEATEYGNSKSVVVDDSGQRRRDVITDLQYGEFHAFEVNVAAAEDELQKDFAAWSSSGTKPPSFDGHAATVLEWQRKLINLVRTVKP